MKQVLDIKQMQHLQELGLELELYTTLYCYVKFDCTDWILKPISDLSIIGVDFEAIPAYTLQDILELLPSSVNWNRLLITFNGCECIFQYAIYEGDPIVTFHNEEMIDAAYAMLCWCIENGHVKTNKENVR